jgi:hypothetical protein
MDPYVQRLLFVIVVTILVVTATAAETIAELEAEIAILASLVEQARGHQVAHVSAQATR